MKPNWKDYLKATGEFTLCIIAVLVVVALVLLAIHLISNYIAIAFAAGVIILIILLFSIVVFETIQELAKTYMVKRLDKDDEM